MPKHDVNFDDLFKGKKEKKKEEKKAEKEVDALIKKGDASSPEEQARRFEEVSRDPPMKGYGKCTLYHAEDNNGNVCLAMPTDDGEATGKFAGGNEEFKVTLYDPLFEIDLFELFQGQLAETPINTIPNLIDEKVQIEMNEKQVWKPEKVKKDWTQWWWIIVAVSFIPMILVGVAMVTGMW